MNYSASERENMHYLVMLATLDNPKEPWSQVTEKLNITKEQLFDVYDFLDREGYLSGMHFSRGKRSLVFVPYYDNAAATQKGLNFMARMEKQATPATPDVSDHSELPSVFVSYNQKSGGDFVDDLEEALRGKANLRRDKKDISAWRSINAFMNTIRTQDFAVLVISDGYLKSAACLFEVMQLIKDVNWSSKTMYVVMDDANIYKVEGRAEYTGYWVQQCESLDESIGALPPATAVELSNELRKYELIRNEIGNFLARVADTKNPPPDAAIGKIGERVSASSNSSGAVVKDKTNLNAQAERLILAACEGGGIIRILQSLSGCDIEISYAKFACCPTNREFAQWKSALEELENRGFIEDTSNNKEVFRVTHKGYVFAETDEYRRET